MVGNQRKLCFVLRPWNTQNLRGEVLVAEDTFGSCVEDRGAWLGLGKPLPGRRGVWRLLQKSGWGTLGWNFLHLDEVPWIEELIFARCCFLNWMGLDPGFIFCAYNFF